MTESADPITVVVVDDQDLVRSGLRIIIEACDDMVVVAEASDGIEGLAAVREHHPAVVLMDIRMPRMDGLAATSALCRDPALHATKVLIVTTFDDDENIFAALQAGAGGFVGKDVAPATLVQAVRTLDAGASLVFPDATRELIAHHTRPDPMPAVVAEAIGRLSAREREVFELVATGLANDEISERLFISNATVKTHLNRCFSKLGVRDRAQMVVLAYEAGVVAPGSTDPRQLFDR